MLFEMEFKMVYGSSKLTVTRNLDAEGDKTKKIEKIETEYPQYETLEEAQNSAGDAEKLLKYINNSVKADSAINPRQLGKAKANLGKTDDEFIALVQSTRRDFGLANADRGLSNASKVSFADQLMAVSADTSLDEATRNAKILELVQAARVS